MTNKTSNRESAAPGLAGAASSDMQKTSSGCGAMMEEMMKKHGAAKDEHAPGGETGQQPQDSTGKEFGCGCGAMMKRMMGKHPKSGTSQPGEQR